MQLKTGDLLPTEDTFDTILKQYVTFSTLHETITHKAAQASLSWICNLGAVCDQFVRWKTTFPQVQPLFSLHSFNDPQFVGFVKQLGVGFICTDKKELLGATANGVDEDSIFFHNRSGLKSNLKAASLHQHLICSVNTERDVKNLYALAPSARTIISVGYGATQFNVSKSVLKFAKSKEMNVVGLKCDLSDCKDIECVETLLENSVHMLEYAESLGFQMQVLDIGASVPVDVGEDDNINKTVASRVNDLLDSSLFSNSRWSSMLVTADVSHVLMASVPARGAASPFSIVTCVQSVSLPQAQAPPPRGQIQQQTSPAADLDNLQKSSSYTCTVNDGIYGSFAGLVFNQQQLQCPSAWTIQDKEETGDDKREVSFTVQGCFFDGESESDDVVCGGCLLPATLSEGDKIVFDHVGFLTNTTAINTFQLNHIQTPHIQFFIHHHHINVAKKLQCKEFRVSRVLAQSDLGCLEGLEEEETTEDCKLDEHEFQLLVESLAMLDRNLVNENGSRFVVQSRGDMNEQPIRIGQGDGVDINGRSVRPMTFF